MLRAVVTTTMAISTHGSAPLSAFISESKECLMMRG